MKQRINLTLEISNLNVLEEEQRNHFRKITKSQLVDNAIRQAYLSNKEDGVLNEAKENTQA